MKRNAKNSLVIFASLSMLLACRTENAPYTATRMGKDFWLVSLGDTSSKMLVRSMESNGNGGSMVIDKRVTFCKADKNFIVAVQYPDMREVIARRLFGASNERGHFLIREAADTVYLSQDDSVYAEGGKLYHVRNGWNPPDSLATQRSSWYYYIVDIRPYMNEGKPYQVYKLFTSDDFLQRAEVLQLPDSLFPEGIKK